MIQAALGHLAFTLNQHLRRSQGAGEDLVAVSNLVGLDGTPEKTAANRLVLMLVNVEKDTHPTARRDLPSTAGFFASSPPLFLNLHVLLAANFPGANYGESLKHLSSALSFFQGHPVLDRSTSPDLHPGIERLILELENLRIPELANLWGILGSRYLPSVLYRLRMVTFAGDDVIGRIPSVRHAEGDARA